MSLKHKIILKYIKDLSVEIPDAESLIVARDRISQYALNLDISSKPLKNKMIEVFTKLTYSDKEKSKKKKFVCVKHDRGVLCLLVLLRPGTRRTNETTFLPDGQGTTIPVHSNKSPTVSLGSCLLLLEFIIRSLLLLLRVPLLQLLHQCSFELERLDELPLLDDRAPPVEGLVQLRIF